MTGRTADRFRMIAALCSVALLGLTTQTDSTRLATSVPYGSLPPEARPEGIQYVPGDQFSYEPYIYADLMTDANATATFIVNYSGFTAQAQTAFQFAVNIWSNIVSSGVPIRIDATFAPLDGNTLGQAGANRIFRDFAGAPRSGTWYPDAIADKLRGADASPGNADIEATFSSTPPVPWYFGTDARPPAGTVDFVSVVLHEIGHGLGFFGSGDVSGGIGSVGLGGFPLSYDRQVWTGSGTPIISVPSDSLASVLTGNNLFFASPAADGASISSPARLFAPSQWQPGSSYSHLDESTYPPGNINSLMTPSIGSAEANHNPGPVTGEIFADVGWGPTGSTPPPTGAPGKPTVNSATVTGGNLVVTWTAGAGATPTSHTLSFFAAGVLAASVPAGPATTISIPLPPGVAGSFTVVITPFAGATPGPASDAFPFTIGGGPGPCTSAPPPVTGLTGAVVGGTASVSWQASPGATSYAVQAGSAQGGADLFPLTNIGATLGASAPVPAGFQAWVGVFAVNACGVSPRMDVFIQ